MKKSNDQLSPLKQGLIAALVTLFITALVPFGLFLFVLAMAAFGG